MANKILTAFHEELTARDVEVIIWNIWGATIHIKRSCSYVGVREPVLDFTMCTKVFLIHRILLRANCSPNHSRDQQYKYLKY